MSSGEGKADATTALARALSEVRRRTQPVRDHVARALAKIDPCEDPDAEPLGLLPLIALTVALVYSLWLYWRFKFQPMQDVGHHVGLSAVVADWGRPGSMYTELYEWPNPLNANALLYTFAGYLGKIVPVTFAFRVGMSFYLAGVPLANLYALRVFGRSAWPAVLAVPLVYNMNYVAGFANLLFAGPFFVLSLPLLHRLLERFTWKRFAAAAFTYVCVFLSHAHVFLWAGALGATLTLATYFYRLFERDRTWLERIKGAWKAAGVSLLTVTPSLLLFARWYDWAFGSGKADGAVQTVTTGLDQGFGAYFKPAQALWHDLGMYALKLYITDEDLNLMWKLGLLVSVAVAFARYAKWKKPPVMEIAFALTVGSYFVLPEAIDSNPVVGSRQMGIALWLLPAIVVPLPAKVSRFARWIVILGSLIFVRQFFIAWVQHLVKFEHTEAAGLEWVLDAAPKRQHLHLVKIMNDYSTVFTWRPNWHVEKYYMADKLGQVADNPAIVSTSSIRYKKGIDPHRITGHGPDWASWANLWEWNELVLVHGWVPTPDQLTEAKKHGRRIRKEGDWELWRRHGDWETGDPESK